MQTMIDCTVAGLERVASDENNKHLTIFHNFRSLPDVIPIAANKADINMNIYCCLNGFARVLHSTVRSWNTCVQTSKCDAPTTCTFNRLNDSLHYFIHLHWTTASVNNRLQWSLGERRGNNYQDKLSTSNGEIDHFLFSNKFAFFQHENETRCSSLSLSSIIPADQRFLCMIMTDLWRHPIHTINEALISH